MRILLVEDEPLLAERLRRGLEEETWSVDLAPDGAAARALALDHEYDLVVLDLVLPDAFGLELLEEWRSHGVGTPVLVLTARDRLDDKLEGFDAGADDYLTKPFSFEELLARVRSLLRRRHAPPVSVLEAGGLRLDRERHEVSWRGEPVSLTPKELAILEHLMLQRGRVQERGQIADRVWGADFEARSNVIDVLVGRLRRKLEEAGAPRLIEAVKGIGYAFRVPGEGA